MGVLLLLADPLSAVDPPRPQQGFILGRGSASAACSSRLEVGARGHASVITDTTDVTAAAARTEEAAATGPSDTSADVNKVRSKPAVPSRVSMAQLVGISMAVAATGDPASVPRQRWLMRNEPDREDMSLVGIPIELGAAIGAGVSLSTAIGVGAWQVTTEYHLGQI